MNPDEVAEKVDRGYLQCKIIIDIMGAPQKHVEDTLGLVLTKLKEEKDVFVVSSTVPTLCGCLLCRNNNSKFPASLNNLLLLLFKGTV